LRGRNRLEQGGGEKGKGEIVETIYLEWGVSTGSGEGGEGGKGLLTLQPLLRMGRGGMREWIPNSKGPPKMGRDCFVAKGESFFSNAPRELKVQPAGPPITPLRKP